MNLKQSKTLKTLLSFFLFLNFLSCTSPSKKFNLETAEGRFQYAEFLEKRANYEQALLEFNKVKSNHSYSPYSKKAALKIADIHYKRKNFLEAVAAHKLFKELYPKHPRIDYVIFHLGMSHFNQAPSSVDRDLSELHEALPYFEKILSSYKESSFFQKALKQKELSLKRLAGKEKYIALFYFKKKFYNSAFNRYEKLFKLYPKFVTDSKTLFYALFSAYQMNKKEFFQKHYKELQKLHPHSKEARKARRQFQNEL